MCTPSTTDPAHPPHPILLPCSYSIAARYIPTLARIDDGGDALPEVVCVPNESPNRQSAIRDRVGRARQLARIAGIREAEKM